MDKLYRFHVDFESGGEAEYLVNGVDATTAARRLSGVLGTNDKVHTRPDPDASLGPGVFVVEDLPCAMDRPDSVGTWLWWVKGDECPRIIQVFLTGEITRELRVKSLNPFGPRHFTVDEWKAREPRGLYTKVVNPH